MAQYRVEILIEERFCFYGNWFSNLFCCCPFRQGNSIKITNCQIKLFHMFV